MRLVLLLLLFPLSALAACPAGIQLSNLPIGTPLPMCIKFESSSLGGCNAGCPGVCVELPSSGTMGPIQTMGTECTYGEGGGDGGGDNGGGEDGGGDNGEGGQEPSGPWGIIYPYSNDAQTGFVGRYLSILNNNLRGPLTSMSNSTWMTYGAVNESRGMIRESKNATLSAVDVLKEIREYTASASGEANGTNQYLSRMESEQEISNVHLKKLVDAQDANAEGEYFDSKFGELFGRMDRDYYGGIQNIDRSTSSSAQNLAAITSQLGTNGVNGHLMDIKHILESGSSGGSGTGQGNDIDYSKMPGSGNNPLKVAKSEYQSSCQGTNCYFDIAAVEKEYKDKQTELTDKYKEIKEDATKVFDYSLSGTAEVPKCFELYSFNGQTYSICPDASGYWETLAALLLFMFYIVALMIIFRR